MNLASRNLEAVIQKHEKRFLYACLVLVFIILVAGLQQGHSWLGDYSLYLQHALNIISGEPYTHSGYIVNPANPWISPQSYPPVFPAVLAPAIKLFGIDVYAIRVYLILILCLGLYIFHIFLTTKLELASSRILAVLFTGLSPWFFDIKNVIIAEFLFIALLYAFFLVTEKFLAKPDISFKQQILFGILIGLLAYLAYGSRSAGIVMVPAFVMAFIFYRRKINICLVVSIAAFGILYILQNQMLAVDAHYAELLTNVRSSKVGITTEQPSALTKHIHIVMKNIPFYIKQMSGHWHNEYSMTVRVIVFAITSLLAIWGLTLLLRRKNISEIFFICYAGMLIVIPFTQNSRYILPVMPLFFMYILKALESAKLRQSQLYGISPKYAVAFLIMLSYAGAYTGKDYSTYEDGPETENSVLLFNYIKDNTSTDSVFLFQKPRVFALYTQRRAFGYQPKHSPEQLWQNVLTLKPDYVLIYASEKNSDYPVIRDAVRQKEGELLQLEYTNPDYMLYKIINNKQKKPD